MDALIPFVKDENLYFRGQSIDILLSIVDCDTYDWFQSPCLSKTDYLLHNELLTVLMRNPNPLLENLIFNNSNCVNEQGTLKKNCNSFPGGSAKCLQLLAFLLSWCRKMYTDTHVLTLSPFIIKELNIWRKNPFVSVDDAVSELQEGEAEFEEERKFAEQLYQDFAVDQFGGQDKGVGAGDNNIKSSVAFIDGVNRSLLILPEKSVEESTSSSALVRSADNSIKESPRSCLSSIETVDAITRAELVQRYKSRGNDLYRGGSYVESLFEYNSGIRACIAPFIVDDVATVPLSEVVVISQLLFNVATVLWKIYSTANASNAVTIVDYVYPIGHICVENELIISVSSEVVVFTCGEELLRLCETVCTHILVLCNDKHLKATYRLANVYLKTNRAILGVNLIDKYLNNINARAAETPDLTPLTDEFNDVDALYTLKSMRRQCLANLMMRSSAGASEPLVNDKVSCIMQSLHARRLAENNKLSNSNTRTIILEAESTSEQSIDVSDTLGVSASSKLETTDESPVVKQIRKSEKQSKTAVKKGCIIPGLESLGDLTTKKGSKQRQKSALDELLLG